MMTNWNEMLDELLDCASGKMNSWDIDFIASFDKQRKRRSWKPSARRVKMLREIWDTVFLC